MLSIWKSSIFWKIYIAVVFVMFALLSFTFYTAYTNLPNISQESYRVSTDKVASRLSAQISLVVEDIEAIAKIVQTRGYFKSSTADELTTKLESIIMTSPYIDSGTIVTKDGDVEAAYPPYMQMLPDTNISGQIYFQQAVATKKVYVSDVTFADTGKYAINVSVPILGDAGQVVCVANFAMHIEENEIFQSVFQSFLIGKTGYTYIVDRSGRIISHPDAERIGDFVIANAVVKKVLSEENGYDRVMNTRGVAMYASYKFIPSLQWGVIAQVPVEETYESFNAFKQSLIPLSIIMFVALSILTILYTKHLLKPIQRLYAAVDEAAQGNYSARIQEPGNTEIGIVSNRFNDMIHFIEQAKVELQHQEEQIRKAEKLSVVGELAAGVAHEIRNPLTSIKGFVQMMKHSDEESAHQAYYSIMLNELDRINFIVSEFLVLAKPQAVHFEKRDVRVLLDHIIVLLDTQAILNNIQIFTEFDEQLPVINCEENQLKQVFINILKNAIEAMPNGGVIHVQALRASNSEIVIRFIDQGSGISSERLAKLGEPFYTTKEKGTGLGLMVSFRIIEAHNGHIDVQSTLNVGTTISLTFPAAKQP